MYSYCGIHAHDVCCFVPENAEPVGILPTPSRSRCGKKGFDSGHEGEADMAEWPWHVSSYTRAQLIPLGSSLKRNHRLLQKLGIYVRGNLYSMLKYHRTIFKM